MMMMEAAAAAAGLVDQRRDHHHCERSNTAVGYANKAMKQQKMKKKKKKKEKESRCNKRRIERHEPSDNQLPMALQRLFLTCRDIFKGPGSVPAPCDVEKLCAILDHMKPEDFGLSSKSQFFGDTVKGTPIVTSTTIYKCKNFSLCLFFLPPTGVIPLHNHPGMTVLSKLLLGTMHIKSYDWVDPVDANDSAPSPTQPRWAKLIADSDFTAPCNTCILYPTTGGNIHEFTAVTTCAVLDVLGPPYSDEEGRDCSYYKELLLHQVPPRKILPVKQLVQSVNADWGKSENDNNGCGRECFRWLEEIEVPESSHMDEIEYLGPQIIDY